MVTVLAVGLGFGIPSIAGLVAFRWWLNAKPKPATTPELEVRVTKLEDWRARSELGKLR